MGLQVRPRGTVSSVGIPMFLAIGAPAGVLEFSRLWQQYSFLGVDSTGISEGVFEGVFDGVFEGIFDGVSEESFEGLFEGLFKGLFKRYALTVDKGRPGRENIPPGRGSEGTNSECGKNEEDLGEHYQ